MMYCLSEVFGESIKYLLISKYMYMLMMEWKNTIHEKYMVCSCQVVQIKLTTNASYCKLFNVEKFHGFGTQL